MIAFKKSITEIPTSICGLALGIASLGWCWEYVTLLGDTGLGGNSQLLGATIAGLILLAVLCKFTLQPRLLVQDLKHSVMGSVLPTFTMTLMIISNSLGKFHILLGDTVWLIALLLHILLLVVFVYYQVKSFQLHHLIPSWFVPPVGILVAGVSFSGTQSLAPIAHGVLIFGTIAYSLLLPLMIYRFIFCDNITDEVKPFIAVLEAPASLCLAGYLSLTAQPSPFIVAIFFGIALLMTLVTYLALVPLLQLPFSPACAAFTFPLVIGATALFKTANWMELIAVKPAYVAQIMNLAYLELVIATVMVSYVTYRYCRLLSLRFLQFKVVCRY